MKKLAVTLALFMILAVAISFVVLDVHGQTDDSASTASEPVHVQVGVYIIDIQSINLANSNYQLDFTLWFNFNPQQINASEVAQFEFINGEPTVKQIDASNGYLEYRVTGTFLKTFDFTNYPFESHTLFIELEHEQP